MKMKISWVWPVAKVAMAVAGGAALCYVLHPKSDVPEDKEGKVLRSRRVSERKDVRVPRRETRIDQVSGVKGNVGRFELPSETTSVSVEPREAESENAMVSTVIRELNELVDAGKLADLIALAHRITNSPQSLFGEACAPFAVKRALLSALSNFGSAGAIEMVGFLADADPAVVDAASTLLQQTMKSARMSDREIAALVVAASLVVHDVEVLQPYMLDIAVMRPTVALNVCQTISETGTVEAQGMVSKVIYNYAGMEGISTVEELQEWVESSPAAAKAEKRAESKDARNAW